MFVTPKVASKHYNVSRETLRLWSESGKIKFTHTKGGHHRYEIKKEKYKNNDKHRKSYIYARVSSKKQENELQNQINKIKSKYPNHIIFKDIGSGINFKRRQFKALLEQIICGNVKEIVVAHKDRLSRFSFEFIEFICDKFETKIIVLSDNKSTSENQELADDLMSIITVFSARYYGRRKYNILQKNKDIS